MRSFLGAALLVAVALAGCTSPAPSNPPTAPTSNGGNTTGPGSTLPGNVTLPSSSATAASYIATEYNFTGPASVPSGWVKLVLNNHGTMLHEAALLRIENHTWDQFASAVMAMMGPPDNSSAPPDQGPPDWVQEAGGVGAVDPGQSAQVTMDLRPGLYAMLCFVPGPDGAPHAAHGMVRPLNVTASVDTTTPRLPVADVEMQLSNYNFTQQPANLTAGAHVFHVTNAGPEPHQVQVIKFPANMTKDDLLAALEGPPPANATGPPPFHATGGVNAFRPGGEAYAVLNLPAGHYVYICFVKDHLAKGMVKEFTTA